ncbi:pulmonary surfactant-associated protein C-like [Dermochelys coriacea]|uniref:pulmonary surfactant-associated protein C-like n=1 Tax=Dermochelys coriacea TaxID=27794 RepID=UPI001CA93A19|nr:pulmonary surfactant-associated protein C-like [Dermochelys coriacea]
MRGLRAPERENCCLGFTVRDKKMDCKGITELTMPAQPPVYSFMPKVSTTQQRIILASVVVILLGFFIVASALVGVYLTQNHTEKVLDMVIQGNKGEEEEQTAMVNERENVAAFHVRKKKSTTIVVYNYNHGLIGLRITNSKKCFVMKMDKLNIPSLDEISRDLPNFNAKQVSGDKMSYSFTEAEPADRTTLGTTLNILCSDIPIYWALPRKIQGNCSSSVLLAPHCDSLALCFCF